MTVRPDPKQRSSGGLFHPTLRVVTAAVMLYSLPFVSASAQSPAKPTRKSFTNAKNLNQVKVLGLHRLSEVASESSTADAIAADVLRELYDQADEHFHKGEWNHMINTNQIIMEGDPHNEEVYANNAYYLWSSDREPQAIETLKRGLSANPDDFYLYDELGQHYLLHDKDYATALTYFEQAVKFKCPFTTYHGLAHCYEHTAQWDKAVDAWEKASRYPGDLIAKVQLGRARARLAQAKTGQNRP